MIDKIYINGVQIDMFEGDNISFNLSINNLGDITTRNSSYSNTFKVPKTSKNMEVFDFAGAIGNNSDVPYLLKDCRYEIDTTVIVANGFVKLIETGSEFYRIAIFDGIIDLNQALGNSTIADLDYSSFNHLLENTSSVSDTYSHTWQEGYVYAVGEFGKGVTDTISCEKLAPSVYARQIWDKIFSSRGLTYLGDFFTTNTDFNELVVPPTKGIDVTEVALTRTPVGTGSTATLNINQSYGDYQIINTPLVFNSETYTNTAIDGSGNLVVSFTGLIELDLTTTYTETDTQLYVEMYRNGSLSVSRQFSVTPNASPYSAATQTYEVTSGDVLSFKVRSNPFNAGYPPTNFNHIYTASVSLDIATLSGGTEINLQNYMSSDLTQKDFVKDVLQRFGLIMIRDRENTSIYEFIEIEELLNNRTNAVDWTDKIISINTENYSNSYAQKNEGDYKYTTDTVPFMEGFINVSNENADYEKKIISSAYQIPDTYDIRIASTNLYDFPIWKLNTDTAAYDIIETTVKLMRLKTVTSGIAFKLFTGSVSSVNPVKFLSLDNMSYQYVFDTYYPTFETLLSSYKEVEVDVKLDLIDMGEIDFTKLIFLKQTGRYYYLDSVRIKSNKSTAKLIEIRNFNS